MSSVVLDLGNGSSLAGDNLEYLGQQGEANFIEVKPDGHESGASITIIGGSKDDKVHLGVAGGSTVLGLDGNDQLTGGHGNDLIDGGEGHDIINGNKGNDILRGGADNDIIDGGKGNDVLSGGHADDTLKGGEGNDTIDGGFGNDLLKGGHGNDLLIGGEGDDILNGEKGKDILKGGHGADIFEFIASDLKSGALDKIIDFHVPDDMAKITGVGSEVTYDPHTGMVSIDGHEAIEIGEGLDIHIVKEEGTTDTWDIM